MIELAQHIEVLLLENDCVIVPGFGGFVAHYAPAVRVEKENLFFPPTRTIGFNPQLRMNDGVLVQSYMAVYDTNFSDATKMVEKEVDELTTLLHEEGKADLANVGEIRYTIHNTYEFVPYDNKITTPYLYGLDSFEMKELAVLQQPKELILTPVAQKEKKTYEIRINRAFLRNAVAMVAAVALFFFMSTPIENTSIVKDNYAQLLPTDLFERIEKESVTMTPVVMAKATNQHNRTKVSARKPMVVREVKVAKAESAPVMEVKTKSVAKPIAQVKETNAPFHIIIASGIAFKDAQTMVNKLIEDGFSGAKVLNENGKVRVSVMSATTREDANTKLLRLRKNEIYQNAWMLAK